jgi:glucan phosphoethanolaminetransferase (alkaline phosphatase superfamily)
LIERHSGFPPLAFDMKKIAPYPSLIGLILLVPNGVWLLSPYANREMALAQLIAATLATIGCLAALDRHRRFAVIVLVPWIVLAPVCAFYSFRFGFLPDYNVIGVSLETDTRELSEFIVSGTGLCFAVCLIAGLALGVTLTRAVFRNSGDAWHGISRNLAVILLICVSIAYAAFIYPRSAREVASKNIVPPEDLMGSLHVLQRSYITAVPLAFAAYVVEQGKLVAESERLGTVRINAAREAIPPGKEIYVLVIGESARPDHWGLFGYPRNTTAELALRNDVTLLHDVVSPWPLTREAVPRLISNSDPLGGIQQGDESLLEIFRHIGFSTYWLSNQGGIGPHDSRITAYASRAEHVVFQNYSSSSGAAVSPYDGFLVDQLEKALNQGAGKMFVVIHLLGSHFQYSLRYPVEFEKFAPSMPRRGFLTIAASSNGEILNSYDNSIAYTDHVLAQVLALVEAQNAISAVFYASDHGESIPSEICSLSMHNHNTADNYRVPAFAWLSRRYREQYPSRLLAIQAHESSHMLSSDLFYTILDAANIKFDNDAEIGKRSLLSPLWEAQPRIVFTPGPIDFDTIQPKGPCGLLQK